ncbi:6296_t:CDS:1, partial [Paraglomus occultum]
NENDETNTTVLSNNSATCTQHLSESDEGKLYIIDGVIQAVYEGVTVDLKTNDILDIIKKWQKHKKVKNSFILYHNHALVAQKLEYKRKMFHDGSFQFYVSAFASKTWKEKTESAKKAIKVLTAKINGYIELNHTLGV